MVQFTYMVEWTDKQEETMTELNELYTGPIAKLYNGSLHRVHRAVNGRTICGSDITVRTPNMIRNNDSWELTTDAVTCRKCDRSVPTAAAPQKTHRDDGGAHELILGWRMWNLSNDGWLAPVTKKKATWKEREAIGKCLNTIYPKQGSTKRCTMHLSGMTQGMSHKERVRVACGCGIHSLKSLNSLPRYGWIWGDVVVGQVAVYGTVVETTLGYISDRVRIEALWLIAPAATVRTERTAAKLATTYGVPVKIMTLAALKEEVK